MRLWLPLALVWAGIGHMAAQLVHDQHGPGRHRADLITPATTSASRLTPTASAPELFDQPDEAGEDTDLRLLQPARDYPARVSAAALPDAPALYTPVLQIRHTISLHTSTNRRFSSD